MSVICEATNTRRGARTLVAFSHASGRMCANARGGSGRDSGCGAPAPGLESKSKESVLGGASGCGTAPSSTSTSGSTPRMTTHVQAAREYDARTDAAAGEQVGAGGADAHPTEGNVAEDARGA